MIVIAVSSEVVVRNGTEVNQMIAWKARERDERQEEKKAKAETCSLLYLCESQGSLLAIHSMPSHSSARHHFVWEKRCQLTNHPPQKNSGHDDSFLDICGRISCRTYYSAFGHLQIRASIPPGNSKRQSQSPPFTSSHSGVRQGSDLVGL